MSGKPLAYDILLNCKICKKEFFACRVNNIYCSNPCRRRAGYENFKNKNKNELEILAKKKLVTSRKHRGSLRRFIIALKLTAGCADCGYDQHPSALDFDHLFDKRREIGSFSTIRSAVPEIEKCDIVCSNCHRIRTCNRKQGFYGKGNGRHSYSFRDLLGRSE
jgi:hypothetical protein